LQKHRSVILRFAGLILACLLIIVGIVLLRRELLAPGLILTLTAIILFAFTVNLNDKSPVDDEEALPFKPYLFPAFIFITSFSLTIATILSMSNWQRPPQTDRWITAGWISSIVLTVIGMLLSIRPHFPEREQVKQWFKGNRQELFILVSILMLGLFLRLYLIDSHPFPWSGDEASVGIEGRRILSGEITDFFDAGWSAQPNWSFIPTAISLAIFGENIFAIRLVSILEGTLSILFLSLLTRELFGRRTALIAAGFLAAFPFHLQFSRIGVNNIIDTMMVCLVLWLVFRAIRKDRVNEYLWAGLATSLTFYTYVGSRLILPLAFGVLVYTAIRQRGYLQKHLAHLGFYLLGVLIAIAPLAFYFISHPDIFMTRIGQENIFLNHWLALQSKSSGQSQAALLWKQFTDTALVYISQPATGNFFNSPNPYLTIIGAVFFLFGMGYAITCFLETRMIILLAWFWLVIFLGGVFTLSPPASTRLIMTSPAVAIFLALGIEKFSEILSRLKLFAPRWQTIFGIVLISILGLQNIAFYFGVYRTKNYFEDATGELTQQVGMELRQLGPKYNYYLFGLPRIFAAFPTVVFLAPENEMYDVDSNSIDGLTIPDGKSAIFVAIPENLADLERIDAKFPGGTWEKIPRLFKVEVLYYAYIVP
jgi:4-amino-4-deoxy-L-arabinose transferase-like glycosyltransferase